MSSTLDASVGTRTLVRNERTRTAQAWHQAHPWTVIGIGSPEEGRLARPGRRDLVAARDLEQRLL
jgi:hypothetical protein